MFNRFNHPCSISGFLHPQAGLTPQPQPMRVGHQAFAPRGSRNALDQVGQAGHGIKALESRLSATGVASMEKSGGNLWDDKDSNLWKIKWFWWDTPMYIYYIYILYIYTYIYTIPIVTTNEWEPYATTILGFTTDFGKSSGRSIGKSTIYGKKQTWMRMG